jgi:hypothetical protein
MNKRRFIWGGIAAVVVGGLAVFNVSLNSQNAVSTIYKANVEALASEYSSGTPCYTGSYNVNNPPAASCATPCVTDRKAGSRSFCP